MSKTTSNTTSGTPVTIPVLVANAAAVKDPIRSNAAIFSSPSLQKKWDAAVVEDASYQDALSAVRQADSAKWPRHIKGQFADFSVSNGALVCRNRLWVPDSELLRTQLLQDSHDARGTGHPGRDGMIDILQRRFYRPGLNNDVRRFVRNCDVCGRGKVWRLKKTGSPAALARV